MGIEPTSDSDCRSTVLKTEPPTRTNTPPGEIVTTARRPASPARRAGRAARTLTTTVGSRYRPADGRRNHPGSARLARVAGRAAPRVFGCRRRRAFIAGRLDA